MSENQALTCTGCGRPMRRYGQKAEGELAGSGIRSGGGLCSRCTCRLERGIALDAPSRYRDYQTQTYTCICCGRVMAGSPATARRRGLVAHGGGGLCRACYARQRRSSQAIA